MGDNPKRRDMRDRTTCTIDPVDAKIETPETVRDRLLQANRHIPRDKLGIT